MDEIRIKSLIERCRICLQTKIEAISLYEEIPIESNDKELISKILLECGNIHVFKDDNKPQGICLICTERAKEAYKFKLHCEKSNEILQNEIIKNLFGLNNVEKLENASGNDNIKIEEIDAPPLEELAAEENVTSIIPFTKDQHIKPENSTIGKSKFSCELNCGKTFTNRSNLYRHKRSHTCPYCNYFSVDSVDISKHIREQHAEDKSYVCKDCGKTFINRSNLDRHQKSHTCPFCNYFSIDRLDISKHVHEQHSEHKSYICKDCGKQFLKRNNLTAHMHTHSVVKAHMCDKCGLSFTLRSSLYSHKRLHTGIKPFSCAECGKAFLLKKGLEIHQAVHFEVRKFACEICGATFKTRQSVNNHKIRHQELKRYKCSICEMMFYTNNEMKRHKMIHTGTRNHPCEVCNKRFQRASNLRTHMRTHTGEKPNVCHVCGKAFNQAVSLRTHLKTHENDSS